MNRVIIFISLSIFSFSCQRKETSLEYYENGKSIKVKTELRDGKKDGKTIFYYENGQIQEVSEWRAGILNGPLISNYPSGKIKSRINYFNGKIVGKAEKFNESGVLEQSNFYDSISNLYNTVMYKSDGNPCEMLPDFYVKQSSNNDSVYFMVKLVNVINPSYLSGILVVGRRFVGSAVGDTLLVVSSNGNNYEFGLRSSQVSEKKLCMQFLFKSVLESKDSVDFFSFEREWR